MLQSHPAGQKPDAKLRQFTPAVDALTNAFKSFKLAGRDNLPNSIIPSYNAALSLASSLRYTTDDLEQFCIAITDLQHDMDFSARAGFFLSALVNFGSEQDYTLDISHLIVKLDFMAARCSKSLTIHGDVGDYFAANSVGAELALYGSAKDFIAYNARADLFVSESVGDHAAQHFLSGDIRIKKNAGFGLGGWMGEPSKFDDSHRAIIVVDGNASDNVGQYMKSGYIVVRGDAGYLVGYRKTGGEINVDGKKKSVCRTQTSPAIDFPSDF